jgi:hypothetical protein
MKKINIAYWIITVLFAAFMIFTAIPNVMAQPESVTFFSSLGYPGYLVPFIGIAKVLGSIAICIPAFRRIKEWAYAGLFFDLAGATYSVVKIYGLHVEIVFMILPIIFLFASYFLWHKKLAMTIAPDLTK